MNSWLSRAHPKTAILLGITFWLSGIVAVAQDLDSGYCQLAPIRDTQVAFAGREIVREVSVDLGQRVRRGDVLVRLDPAGLPARLDRARAELLQAERAMARADALQGVLVAEERDQRETELAVRLSALREIELEMERLTLRSPHSGIIVEIMAREGELLQDSVAVRIVDLSRLLVEADLPLALLADFETGQVLNLITETGGHATARINFVDPLVDLASRSFRIRAELENSEGTHSPGTTCTLLN